MSENVPATDHRTVVAPEATTAQQARSRLVGLLVSGLLLLVIGGGITLAGLPRHDGFGGFEPARESVIVVGGILAASGQLLVLVGVIGFGVMLGVRAAGTDPDATDPPDPAASGGSVGSAP